MQATVLSRHDIAAWYGPRQSSDMQAHEGAKWRAIISDMWERCHHFPAI